MSVPLIEQPGDASGSSSGNSQVTADVASGPSITFVSNGSTVTLETEDLEFYLLAIQTFLLLYVAYKEVSR